MNDVVLAVYSDRLFMAAVAVYVLAIQVLGVYVASAIYIAGFMIVLGKFNKVKSALLGVAIAVVFFLMFEVWFKIPLFKGALNPLGFLGY